MKQGIGNSRIARIDDARSLVIFLVVMIHASVTYSGLGGWYVTENKSDSLGLAQLVAFGLFNSFTQAWFMGILFFFGGHFASEALAKKGTARFIQGRLLRLGLPLASYMLVINPLMLYFVAYPEASRELGSFPEVYRTWYIASGRVLSGNGPLWFAEALLVFSLVYAAVADVQNRFFGKATRADAMKPAQAVLVPAKRAPTTRVLLLLALAIAAAAFAIRIVMPVGTSWMNLQFCFFASYVALFVLGVRAAHGGWFDSLTGVRSLPWFRAAFFAGIPVWFVIMATCGALKGDMNSIMGGGTWQSAVYALWESFVAVAMCLGLPAFLAGRKRAGGAFSAFLSRNSFSVYVFHPVFLIGLTRLLSGWRILPIAKAAIVGSLAFAVTAVFAELVIRRVPGIRKYF